MNYPYSIKAPPLIVLCFCIDLMLPTIYVADLALHHPFGAYFSRLVDLDAEINLPTWYSSVKLFLVGFLFLILAHHLVENKRGERWLILVLGSTFLVLSLDEVTEIHEHIGYASDALLTSGNRELTPFFRTGIWVFLIGVPFLILMLSLILVLNRYINDAPIVKKYVLGLVVFVGSAAGIEFLSNFAHGKKMQILEVCAEEFGEMIGATILLWATYDLLVYHGVQMLQGDPGSRRLVREENPLQ